MKAQISTYYKNKFRKKVSAYMFDDTGKDWYREANQFCREVAGLHNIPIEKVAGITAILSPSVQWETNKKDVIGLIKDRDYTPSTYGQNKFRALRILDGEPFDEVIKTRGKVYNFYYNLLYPDNPDYVTIDTRILNYLHGRRLDENEKNKYFYQTRYDVIKNIFQIVASDIGLIPCELQAIVWVNNPEV